MKYIPLILTAPLWLATPAFAKNYLFHTFKKTQLSDQFWSEGAAFGDLNRDGKTDIVAGPYWYEGPEFKVRHQYYPATASFVRKRPDGSEEKIPGFEGALGVDNKYSDNFFAFVSDFNGDRWNDILIVGFPGLETVWYENPQKREGQWTKHLALAVTDNESPTFTDLTGDKRPELVCASKGRYGYATPDRQHPDQPWKFHPLSPVNEKYQRFTHGLGVGDVNGDRRPDLLEKDGWWEQPKSLAGDPVWKFHPFQFTPLGGAQMFAYDVDGDGLNDVITSYAAHGFGLLWYKQVHQQDENSFTPHVILSPEQKRVPDRHGVSFSELHALDLVDMDGDGLKDIVAGKRFWSHGHAGDPDLNDTAVLYWFKLMRTPHNDAEFVPHLIDDGSGVGTQVVAGPGNSRKHPDIVVGNKRGTFYFRHEVRKVSQAEWESSQPKPLAP